MLTYAPVCLWSFGVNLPRLPGDSRMAPLQQNTLLTYSSNKQQTKESVANLINYVCIYIYIRFLQVDCNLKLQQCRTSSCSRMVSPIWTACWAISRASSCLPAWQNCCFACQESVAQAPANMLRANLAVSLQANRRTACSSPPPDFIEEAQVRSLQKLQIHVSHHPPASLACDKAAQRRICTPTPAKAT